MQVSTNGIISFRSKFSNFLISTFPSSTVPLIAPLWADFDFRSRGNVFYRMADDETTLVRARESIVGANANFTEYYPSFCVIVTWSEATLFSLVSDDETDSVSIYLSPGKHMASMNSMIRYIGSGDTGLDQMHV